MKGRKPKPTSLRVLEGNPGKRPLPENEAKPRPLVCASAPGHLGRIGRKEWRRISKQLARCGLLTGLDLVALGAYCKSFESWIEAIGQIEQHGLLVKAQSGFPMQSPYVAIANKAQSEMRKWLTEFGMTPSSRTRVAASLADDDSDDDDLLSR